MPPARKSRRRQESKPYNRPPTPCPTATQEPNKKTRDWGGSLQPRTYDPALSPQTAWRDPEDARDIMVALEDHILLRRFIEVSEELFRQDNEGTGDPQRYKDFVVHQANLFREKLGLDTANVQGKKGNDNEIGEQPQGFAISILRDDKLDDCVTEKAPDAHLVQGPSKNSSAAERERKKRSVKKQRVKHEGDNTMPDTPKTPSATQIVFTPPFAEDKSKELTASEIMKDVLDAYPDNPFPAETVVKEPSISKQRTQSRVTNIQEKPLPDEQNERPHSPDKERGEVQDHRLWETDL